jgi:predicted RND superfamily exporter protein
VAKLGRAVFFGALTTAVGFLALILSGSMGFSQLGVLIAIGIFFAGLFMCTILFLFVRQGQAPQRHDWVFEIVKKYVRWSVQRPMPMIIIAGGILLLLSAFGFSPVPPLRFEASVRSLEPKNSRAAEALQAIMAKMPTRWEPVLAIVRARDAQELHDDWQRITAHWTELQAAGKIKAFSDLDGRKS